MKYQRLLFIGEAYENHLWSGKGYFGLLDIVILTKDIKFIAKIISINLFFTEIFLLYYQKRFYEH